MGNFRSTTAGVGVGLLLTLAAVGLGMGQETTMLAMTDAVIVTGANPPALVKFAADELAKGLDAVTGKRPPVVAERPKDDVKPVVILDTAGQKLGGQGFSLRCGPNPRNPKAAVLVIAGNPLGVLHGVRDFLHHHLKPEGVAKVEVVAAPAVAERVLWVWLPNLGADWREFIDFASEWKCTSVVIWGLDGWREDGKRCREIVAYAHERGVKVIHGFGLNGYHEGVHILKMHPELAAVIPERLKDTAKAKASVGNVFCPSKELSQHLVRDLLLKAADTGIDGFNFETADVDYVTCHCETCEKRFDSASETEGTNKPPTWSIDQVNAAVEFLQRERPSLWLTSEYAMQCQAKKPYTDSPALARMNKEIDPRSMIVWAEGLYPPQDICEQLARGRENVGFYIRGGETQGISDKPRVRWKDIVAATRRLQPISARCIMYRSWLPREVMAVNMAVAAEAMWNPNRSDAEFERIAGLVEADRRPGRRFALVRHVVPGNIASPAHDRKVTASSEDGKVWPLMGLTDGVADERRGMWLTERDSPESAWAEIAWPQPKRINRVRLFHQLDGHYRSKDYTVQVWDGQAWRDVDGMPVRDNQVRGWIEHKFAPVSTDRVRVTITRAMYGNRMGLGELEVYEAE